MAAVNRFLSGRTIRSVGVSDQPDKTSSPRPAVPSPAALAGRAPQAPLVPVAPPVVQYDEEAAKAAMAFGNVAEDGTVTVQDGTQVRTIGQAEPGSESEKALLPFAHAYLDIVAFLDLLEQKLQVPNLTQLELNRLLEQLKKNLKEPKAVGDIPALRQRGAALRETAKAAIAALDAERAKLREAAKARREEFVSEIEKMVSTPPERMQWRTAGEKMRSMVSDWQAMQKAEPIDRASEDSLWKRLSAARSEFDRARRSHFAQLDQQHAEAKRVKEALIARAEEMKDSTDWGPTVRAFRALMDDWRNAPRAQRKTDDQLWKRFKAAQDEFFAARNADLQASEAEQKENLTAKLALLDEAEKIVPVEDIEAAKKSLRAVQDRWEEIGKVPRADLRSVEDRLRAVERAVKDAEEQEWRRTDPRTKARVEGASSQLQAAIQSYQDELDKARESGDPARIKKAEAALEARKQWLEAIEKLR
ncbi:DUF349 domain-containing protein [Dermabacteraceae bacterium TAE3-ERU5]|nr:DUF349 domain-containing protein [Dermabacteraceae bacterium TAE3-ERU5]